MTLIQRFGSALNANVHFHMLVLDGVYRKASGEGRPRFVPVAEPAPEAQQAQPSTGAIGDFDGDGRADVLRNDVDDTSYWEALLSTGSNFSLSVEDELYVYGEPRIADFNGDGLDDVFQFNDSGTSYLHLSTGDGNFVQVWSSSGTLDDVQFGDWNNDGLADLAYPSGSSMQLFVSTGDPSASSYFSSLTTLSGWSGALIYANDFNGDGVADLWRRESSSDTQYSSSHSGFDRIDEITNGFGAVTTIAYADRPWP